MNSPLHGPKENQAFGHGRPHWLVEEEHFKGRALLQKQIDWFLRQRVPIMAIAKPEMILADDVVFDADSFRFARHCPGEPSTPAITILVMGAAGAVDIAAWAPPTLATWTGQGYALGEEQIFGPRLDDSPLPIWRTPLSWLRSSRQGIVLLPRMQSRAAWVMLDHLPGVLAEDIEHGEEIEKLRMKPTTKIYVPAITDQRGATS